MVHDLLQVEFLALLYFKQKSVFSPLVRQKANPAISCWAAVGSLCSSITVGMELFLHYNKIHVQQLLCSWRHLFLICYRDFHQELRIYGAGWGLIRFSDSSFIKNAVVELA